LKNRLIWHTYIGWFWSGDKLFRYPDQTIARQRFRCSNNPWFLVEETLDKLGGLLLVSHTSSIVFSFGLGICYSMSSGPWAGHEQWAMSGGSWAMSGWYTIFRYNISFIHRWKSLWHMKYVLNIHIKCMLGP
jgi:hypothetical protein